MRESKLMADPCFDLPANLVNFIRPLRGRRFSLRPLSVGSIAFHPRIFIIRPLRGRVSERRRCSITTTVCGALRRTMVREEIVFAPFGDAASSLYSLSVGSIAFHPRLFKIRPLRGRVPERRRCSITITVGGALRGTHGEQRYR